MDLQEVKRIRKQLGLTQSELASRAGISQSLIAKIEAGTLDPAYSNAQKVFDALTAFSSKKELSASQIMHSGFISVSPSASIRDAIEKLRKHGFSQLPVITNHQVVGMISESLILAALLEGKKGTVEDVMAGAPPTIDADSPLSTFSNLLQHFQMVLVSRKGHILGLITKADVLGALYRR